MNRGLLLIGWTLASGLHAESIALLPSADTSITQNAPANNFGGASFFNAGTAHNFKSSHGLIQFDISGHLPAGAQIQSVALVLDVIREPGEDAVASAFGWHRLLLPWGEGNKVPSPLSPGVGAPATAGEATWLDRFAFTGATWSAPGGTPGIDYVANASGDQFIYGAGDSPYIFASTPDLVADVQLWLDHPSANFGWMCISLSEGTPGTARSFGSREAIGPPRLEIEFTLVPEPATGLLLGGAMLMLFACRVGVRCHQPPN